MLLHPHNEPHSLIDQRRLRQLTSLRPQMRIIVFQHKLVDINLADPPRNTSLRNFIRETVGAVEDDADAAGDLFADGFESVSIRACQQKKTINVKKSIEIAQEPPTSSNPTAVPELHTRHAHSPQQAPKNPPPWQ
jgi:hypothetical protein